MSRGEPDLVHTYLEALARLGHRLADRAAIFEARGWTEETFAALEAEALRRLEDAAREGRPDRLAEIVRALAAARSALLAGPEGPEPPTEARPTTRAPETSRADSPVPGPVAAANAPATVDPADFMVTLHSPRRS